MCILQILKGLPSAGHGGLWVNSLGLLSAGGSSERERRSTGRTPDELQWVQKHVDEVQEEGLREPAG